MATEIITSFDQQCDSSGDPISGALVYVYDVGTTTLKSVWTDTALSVAGANPIVCDSAGRHDMRYIATGSYKIVVKTSAGVTQYTRDNVDGRVPVGSGALAIANGGTASTTAAAAVAALGAATSAEVAALSATVASLAGASASTEETHLATGTTAQRDAAPIAGDVRHNTTTGKYEGYIAAWWNFFTGADIATQADMEAATSTATVVTPGRQQYHPGAAKAWAFVTVTGGTPAVTVSHNVTSVTDNGVGDYTLNLTTAFSSANFAAVAMPFAFAGLKIFSIECSAKTASTIRIKTYTATGGADANLSAVDSSFFVVAYGDQ